VRPVQRRGLPLPYGFELRFWLCPPTVVFFHENNPIAYCYAVPRPAAQRSICDRSPPSGRASPGVLTPGVSHGKSRLASRLERDDHRIGHGQFRD
jgi:hypothetical protein